MLETGQILQWGSAQYQLKTPLDSGGQGVVWRVRRLSDGLELALKTARVSDDLATTESNIDHLRDEIAFLRGIPNPEAHYIIQCLDHGHWQEPRYGDIPAFVMPYCERRLSSLERAEDGAMLLRLGWQLADALAWVHAHTPNGRVSIHRDLKPQNILLDAQGEPRLIDFGITKFTGATETCLARDGTFYAPEQKLPTQPGKDENSDRFSLTEKADLYNLGLILYLLARGGQRAPAAQAILRQYDTRARHIEHLAANPRGLIGQIGGLASKERGQLYQALMELFSGQTIGTMAFQGPSRLPDEALLAEQVSQWIERLLAPAPEDRPEARAFHQTLRQLEQALTPDITQLQLGVEPSQGIVDEPLRFTIRVQGHGLPAHGRWLEFSIDQQPLGANEIRSAAAPSDPILNGEGHWHLDWRPTLRDQGERRASVRVRIAAREWQDQLSLRIEARPEQLWQAGGKHRLAALAQQPRAQWLDQIAAELPPGKYLTLLQRLSERHPGDSALGQRIAELLWSQGEREEALNRDCRIDWIDQLNDEATTFGERVELLQLLERLGQVHPDNGELQQRIEAIKATPIIQPEPPTSPGVWIAAAALLLTVAGGGYFALRDEPSIPNPPHAQAPAEEPSPSAPHPPPQPLPQIRQAPPSVAEVGVAELPSTPLETQSKPQPEEPTNGTGEVDDAQVAQPVDRVDLRSGPAEPTPEETPPVNRSEPILDRLASLVEAGDAAAIRTLLPEIRRQVEQGDPQAAAWLGYLHGEGLGLEADLAEARRYMQLALQRGHAEAGDSIDNIDRYADMLLASRDPDERQQGYRIAQAAAEAGDINAMLWLAFRHERGDGVEISQDRASHWYGKAAAAGDAVAAERLARLDPH